MRGWFHSGWRILGGRATQQRTRCAHLTVERLEDRSLLSGYLQTNLVSDVPGLARFTDPNLVNPWGLSAGPTGPFWSADNGSGVSTLYDGQGQSLPGGAPLVVSIPGSPTGTVFNGGLGFIVSANGMSGASSFIFATEDGTIAGWSPNVDPTHAVVAVDNSSAGAVYKGLALGTDSSGRTLLYATNFHTGGIDVFDQSFQATHLAGSFADPNLPAGFAPFGIQNIDGMLYVTYARQDAAKYDDVAAPGNGFVDVFNGDGALQQRLASGGLLNSPWGVARAPADFGEFSNDLLVGNFGDGHINVFEPSTGRFVGQLDNTQGHPHTIDHQWGLAFGNGSSAGNAHTLFFNAGIDGEQHGLFGTLQSTQNPDREVVNNDSSAGNLYGTPTDPSAAATAGSEDNYPLPPAAGPAPRGDIVVQPTALPSLLPLQTASSELASALLTVTDGPRISTVAPALGTPVPANRSAADFNVAPPTVTASIGQGSASSAVGQSDAMPSSDPGALGMLLSLQTQPDLMERMATATEPPSNGNAPVVDAVYTRLKGDQNYPVLPAGKRMALADALFAEAIQTSDDPEAMPNPQDGPEQATITDTVVQLARRALEREPALEATDLVTVLLVTGGTCLMLGVGHAARRMNHRAAPSLAPTLSREPLPADR